MNSGHRPHSVSTSSTLSSDATDTECAENENIDVTGDGHPGNHHHHHYHVTPDNPVSYYSIEDCSLERTHHDSSLSDSRRRLSSSGSSHRSSASSEEIRELRSKINSRERKRMHDLNSAMDSLREIMPYAKGPSVRKLSKIATLSLAKNYIQMMSKTIEEMKQLLDDIYRSGGTHPAFTHSRIHAPPYISTHHHSFPVMPAALSSSSPHGHFHPVLQTASHNTTPFSSHHHLQHHPHQNILTSSSYTQNVTDPQPSQTSPPVVTSASTDGHIMTTSQRTTHSVSASPVCTTPRFPATPCTCPGLSPYSISMLSSRPDSIVAYSLESNTKRPSFL